MKKLLFLLIFMLFSSLTFAEDNTAILNEDLSIYLPEIKYQGVDSGFSALFKYDSNNDAWRLAELEENTGPEYKQEFLNIINKFRTKGAPCSIGGLNPLVWDESLYKTSYNHSKDMSENGYFSHDGLNGSNFVQRAREAGFIGSPLGENIALGQRDVQQALNSWINSPGHCTNIMNPLATKVGYGMYDYYHTMVTGR